MLQAGSSLEDSLRAMSELCSVYPAGLGHKLVKSSVDLPPEFIQGDDSGRLSIPDTTRKQFCTIGRVRHIL
jgi:hypothetical protein